MNSARFCKLVHVFWTICMVVYCCAKFIWSYDWTILQDVITTVMLILVLLYEQSTVSKAQRTDINSPKGLLIYDVAICAIVVLFPVILGKPTLNYVIYNILVPVTTMCLSMFIRRRGKGGKPKG